MRSDKIKVVFIDMDGTLVRLSLDRRDEIDCLATQVHARRELLPEEARELLYPGARVAGLLRILIDREGRYAEIDCLKAVDLLRAVKLLL